MEVYYNIIMIQYYVIIYYSFRLELFIDTDKHSLAVALYFR